MKPQPQYVPLRCNEAWYIMSLSAAWDCREPTFRGLKSKRGLSRPAGEMKCVCQGQHGAALLCEEFGTSSCARPAPDPPRLLGAVRQRRGLHSSIQQTYGGRRRGFDAVSCDGAAPPQSPRLSVQKREEFWFWSDSFASDPPRTSLHVVSCTDQYTRATWLDLMNFHDIDYCHNQFFHPEVLFQISEFQPIPNAKCSFWKIPIYNWWKVDLSADNSVIGGQ